MAARRTAGKRMAKTGAQAGRAQPPVEPELEAFSARTVLVPNERVALQMRQAAVQHDDPGALVGCRTITFRHAAEEVLHEAGVEFSPGEETLRPLRLRALLHRGPRLRAFPPDLVRTTPGWDRAFARTIASRRSRCLFK